MTLKKSTEKGFTLIELLVVVAIIGVLSSVVLASLNSARGKGRDAARASEIKELEKAIQMYYSDNGSFPSNAGCLNGWCCLGAGDAGTCWSGSYHGSTALDNSLSPKYIGTLPRDPLNNIAKAGDAYMYRIDTDAIGIYVTLHWGIENPNPTSTKDCLGGTMGNWGSGGGNGGNYWCMYITR